MDRTVDHSDDSSSESLSDEGPPPPPSEVARLLQAKRLYLTTAKGTHDLGLQEHEYELSVMMQNGVKRPTRDVFEWVQQFCIEQCARF